ncbi:hypothetical protein K3495_g16828, partial [Podosphaera aphanis]
MQGINTISTSSNAPTIKDPSQPITKTSKKTSISKKNPKPPSLPSISRLLTLRSGAKLRHIEPSQKDQTITYAPKLENTPELTTAETLIPSNKSNDTLIKIDDSKKSVHTAHKSKSSSIEDSNDNHLQVVLSNNHDSMEFDIDHERDDQMEFVMEQKNQILKRKRNSLDDDDDTERDANLKKLKALLAILDFADIMNHSDPENAFLSEIL